MAYFSNGSEAECFDCANCKYGKAPCPIAAVQLNYNYDQHNDKSGTAKKILDTLVLQDGTCTFYEMAKADLFQDDNQLELGLVVSPIPTKGKGKTHKAKNNTPFFIEATDKYYIWHQNKFGNKPRILAADAVGLKSILKHLESLVEANKDKPANNTGEQTSLYLFGVILDNWDRLDPFLQKATDLRQINSNINLIINNFNRIKNGEQTSKTGYQSAADKNKSDLRNMASKAARDIQGD